MSSRTPDPRDPRQGRRGLDAPAIPGSIPPDAEQAAAQERIRMVAEAETKQLMMSYLMHEIGNPLNGVIGLTQLLLSAGAEPLTPTQRRYLNMVAESGQVLQRLLSDALDLARHETGNFSVKTQVVSVRECLESAVASVRVSALSNNVMLEAPEGALDSHVMADPVRLRQCLDNLLSNACKYGGDPPRVTVHVQAKPTTTEIAVQDAGPGLTPEQVNRLFVPFDRLGQQFRPGHGLGLAVTRMLAEAMGGLLEVASTPGQGSRFSLVLPTA